MNANVEMLLSMLHTRRPAYSKSERKFIADYLMPLELDIDSFGNLSKRIGTAPVLWSCHTDTVHKEGGTQKIKIKGDTLSLHGNANSNCLGADDTAGVWLMSEMIRANRPGLYVFHRAEEIGGLGSRHIATNNTEFIDGIQYAIALDRKGTKDVITHQAAGRCSSNAFADELSIRLGNGFRANDTGLFTDTANYMEIIPECSNLSVGYQGEHTQRESLDLAHLLQLRDSLIALDTTGLPVERDPTIVNDWSDYGWSFGCNDNGRTSFAADDRAWAQECRMTEIIKRNPELIAEILSDYGIGPAELAEEIYAKGGSVSSTKY